MNSLKNLKILLIPNRVLNYDLFQLEDIKVAFSKFNVDAHIFTLEYTENKIKNFLKDNSFDVIFAINKGKPLGLNKKIRFISWFQDFYYDSDNFTDYWTGSSETYTILCGLFNVIAAWYCFYSSSRRRISKKFHCI